MAKIIIETTATDGCIVSKTDCTHLKFADYFVLDIVLNIKQSEENVILI